MENTKDHIIKSSITLFIKDGYHKVSMNELVRASGLSKGAFYHYFSSKEELFREALTSFFTQVMGEEYFKLDPERTTLENLNDVVNTKAMIYREMLEYTGHKKLDTGIFMLIFHAIGMFDDFREMLRGALTVEEGKFAQIFAHGKAKGEVRPQLDETALGKNYAAMLDGSELHAISSGGMDELHSQQLELTKVFYDMIRCC